MEDITASTFSCWVVFWSLYIYLHWLTLVLEKVWVFLNNSANNLISLECLKNSNRFEKDIWSSYCYFFETSLPKHVAENTFMARLMAWNWTTIIVWSSKWFMLISSIMFPTWQVNQYVSRSWANSFVTLSTLILVFGFH